MLKRKTSHHRCSRHLRQDLVIGPPAARVSEPLYQKLIAIPKGHVKTADIIYDQLPQESPLRKVEKSDLAPVYLKEVRLRSS